MQEHDAMNEQQHEANRLIIVSNRLPIVVTRDENGECSVSPGQGGLVTALAPVLRGRGGTWIGWPGVVAEDNLPIEQMAAEATSKTGYMLKPVVLSQQEKQDYYLGFANEVLWPLFHDLFQHCNFEPRYWQAYQQANAKFARVIAENIHEDDFIWVHDYHLIRVAAELRKMEIRSRIGFFLHIPFPPLDIFLKLPWRSEILHALLEYDLVGFQTHRDRRNFLQCINALMTNVSVRKKGHVARVHKDGREIRVGSFPISIDFQEFASQAKSEGVADAAWFIHEDLPDKKIILGVDRLDYTKGIPERLKAYRNLLERYPDLQRKVSLVQVAVPSRTEISYYKNLKKEIDELVGQIYGQFGHTGWVPIFYFHRSLAREELLAFYRTAEIALITPLKDGMNLVAKEYCASSIDNEGVLILSESAGAASQLHSGALMVNPYDIEGVADAMYQAITMERAERVARMSRMRQRIRRQDIFAWVGSFLKAGIDKDLGDFPIEDDFLTKD